MKVSKGENWRSLGWNYRGRRGTDGSVAVAEIPNGMHARTIEDTAVHFLGHAIAALAMRNSILRRAVRELTNE
jgi:hypothetical protein